MHTPSLIKGHVNTWSKNCEMCQTREGCGARVAGRGELARCQTTRWRVGASESLSHPYSILSILWIWSQSCAYSTREVLRLSYLKLTRASFILKRAPTSMQKARNVGKLKNVNDLTFVGKSIFPMISRKTMNNVCLTRTFNCGRWQNIIGPIDKLRSYK